ncbi:hypothetical protein ACLBWS_05285 [Brucellaceae bacterium D45D]
MALQDFFIWGEDGTKKTPEQINRERRLAQAMISSGIDTSPVGHWTQGAARMANALVGNIRQGRADKAERAGIEGAAKKFAGLDLASLMNGGAAYPASVAAGASPTSAVATGTVPQGKFNFGENADALRSGIIETAEAIGADPVDLATAISYETAGTFDPLKAGPRTQHGQHRGLIQFGEPQAKQHGVDWNNPLGSQLGANGAVANYFRASGFKPGMSGLDLYSTINAGSPGRYSASDANNGGAPGDVRDKWERQMSGHRAKAMALLSGGQQNQQAPVQVASLDPSIGLPPSPVQNMPNRIDPSVSIDPAQATQPMPYAPTGAVDPQQAMQPMANQTAEATELYGPNADVSEADLAFARQATGGTGAPAAIDRIAPRDLASTPTPSPAQPQTAGPSAELLRQNDLAFGGALAPQGSGPVQVADASGYFPAAPSADRAPIMGSYAAPLAPQQGGNLQQLLETASDPWLNETQRGIIGSVIDNRLKQNDPLRALQIQKLQSDIARGVQTSDWSKLDDNRLYNQRTGEIRDLPVNPNAPAGGDLGLNPQYGLDQNGNPVLLQLGKNGKVVQSQMPDGVTLSKEPIKLDAGTHFVLLDPITRQPVGQIPKDVAGAAAEGAGGKAQGEARAALPTIEGNAGNFLSMIKSLEEDEYLDSMLGPWASRMPNVSADSERVQAKMNQIQGQTFLQAFNSLRGGGAITEIEGQKATEALARLNSAQSPTDYRQALTDLRTIVQNGVLRARSMAGVGSAGPSSNAGANDPLGIR